MKHFDFFKYDLNLIIALDALFEERSVTRAAARVGITQSAMSQALRRLRAALKDDLFIRTSAGIEPTNAALALAGSATRSTGADPCNADQSTDI